MAEYSVSPSGERFPLPRREEYAAEFTRVETLAKAARAAGQEVVVVMGVGFVGAVMAAIVADTTDKKTGKVQQVRDRLPAAQQPVVLEDPDAQPRSVPGQGRGPPRSTR